MPVEVEILKLPQAAERWYLVNSFLELRNRTFIGRKKWSLVVHKDIEFEQYDTATYPYYVIAHKDGVAVAGCRLIRCDQRLGSPQNRFGYTYMINDAFHGRIDLPKEICFSAPPTTPDHWELTRLCAEKGHRDEVLLVMRKTYEFLAEQGAVGCLCLASPAVRRIANISGYETHDIGPMVGAKDEEKFLAFKIPIIPRPIGEQSVSKNPQI